jgi:hypothetical protein
MSVYILYRKHNICDGDHEPTKRLYASLDVLEIFTLKNYEALRKYEYDYMKSCEEDYVNSREEENLKSLFDEEESDGEQYTDDDDENIFYYFILEVKLGKLNKNGKDDGYLFWDPNTRSNGIFQGNLEKFKKIVDYPEKLHKL